MVFLALLRRRSANVPGLSRSWQRRLTRGSQTIASSSLPPSQLPVRGGRQPTAAAVLCNSTAMSCEFGVHWLQRRGDTLTELG